MNNTIKTKLLKKKLLLKGIKSLKCYKSLFKYVNKEKFLDLDKVVQCICKIKYLDEYCHFYDIKKDLFLNKIYDSKTNNEIDSEINFIAEKIALDTWSHGIYPVIFPWENNYIFTNQLDFSNELDYDKTTFFDKLEEVKKINLKIVRYRYILEKILCFIGLCIFLKFF